MEQRTCNIIMCCKGHCKLVSEYDTSRDAIAAYMGAECDFPAERYIDPMLERIVLWALYDYIDHADRPSYDLMNLFYQYATKNPPLLERICAMFNAVSVTDGERYLNGFTEELIKQSEIDLSPEKYKDNVYPVDAPG